MKLIVKLKCCRHEEVDDEKRKTVLKYAEWLYQDGQPEDLNEALKTELNNNNVETARIIVAYFLTTNPNVITTILGSKRNFLENVNKEFVEDIASCLENEINLSKDHPDGLQTTEADDGDGESKGRVVDLTNCMLMLLSQKNMNGKSAFDYRDLLRNNIALLDGLQDIYISTKGTKTVEEREDEHKHMEFDKTLAECYPGFSKIPENIPFEDASASHPLKAIGNSGHLALMKHPYMQMYLDIYWSSFGCYLFYTHLILYLLFLFFLTSFITSHEYNTSDSNLNFSSSVPVFTEISRYSAMILSICGLVFEAVQFRTERAKYFTKLENYVDLVVFIGAVLVVLVTLGIDYDAWSHGLGCFLILLAALKAAWLLSYVPYIGFSFQMLLAIIVKVCMVCPVIIFFVIVFAVIFHNLLQNQEAFSHVGFSIIKVMVMIVGDIEFGSVFFDATNVNSLEALAFIFLATFLTIMTVSVMVMLIGLAVHVISQINLTREQSAFFSRVDLILQYSYMFSGLSRMIHDKPLSDFKPVLKDFNSYINNLKWDHLKFNEDINDPQAEISERVDNLVREIDSVKHVVEPIRKVLECDVLGWLKLLKAEITDLKNNQAELKEAIAANQHATRSGQDLSLALDKGTPNQPIGGPQEGISTGNEGPLQSAGDQGNKQVSLA